MSASRYRRMTLVALCVVAVMLVVGNASYASARRTATAGPRSTVNPQTATSAKAFGGLPGLIKAAQKEGTLNVIALPPKLGGLRQDHLGLHGQVPYQDQLREPERQQPGRGQRRHPAEGHEPSAGRRRLGPDHHAGEPEALHALHGDGVECDHQGSEGGKRPVVRRLHGVRVDRLLCEHREDGADDRESSPQLQVQGHGRPQRQSAPGLCGLQRRRDGGAGERRLGQQHRAWRDLLQEPQVRRELPAVDPTPATEDSGQTPIVSTGTTTRRARRLSTPASTGSGSSRRTTSCPRTTSRRLSRTAHIRQRLGCGKSSSTAPRPRTGGCVGALTRCCRPT